MKNCFKKISSLFALHLSFFSCFGLYNVCAQPQNDLHSNDVQTSSNVLLQHIEDKNFPVPLSDSPKNDNSQTFDEKINYQISNAVLPNTREESTPQKDLQSEVNNQNSTVPESVLNLICGTELYIPKDFLVTNKSLRAIIDVASDLSRLEPIERILVERGHPTLESDRQGILYNKEKTLLIVCPCGKNRPVKIREIVTRIYKHAFKNCQFLPNSITIPTTVENIGDLPSFENCDPTTKDQPVQLCAEDQKKTVIILLGESGAGKTTIAQYLSKYGYVNIPTYTTRSQRYDGEQGHYFVDSNSAENILNNKSTNERKLVYITYFANNWYWAYQDQINNYEKSVIAFNPTETKTFKDCVKDRRVVVIYLKTNRDACVDRMKNRAIGGTVAEQDLAKDITGRISQEKKEYSSFSCDFVIDTTLGLTETFANLENCLSQLGLK